MCVVISAARRCAAIAALLVVAACFRSSAPPGWLPVAVDAQRNGFGSWISVQGQPNTAALAEGELIAIDADTVHVFSQGRLVSVSRASVCCAVLAAYRMDLSELQTWWAMGTISTLSHGWGLILSAPIWVIGGATAVASASYAPRIIGTDPAALSPFARFPQGIPAGLDRSRLRSKP